MTVTPKAEVVTVTASDGKLLGCARWPYFRFASRKTGDSARMKSTDLFAGCSADVVAQAHHFDAYDILNHRFQDRSRRFDQLGSYLLEQVPPLLRLERLDQLRFGRVQDAVEANPYDSRKLSRPRSLMPLMPASIHMESCREEGIDITAGREHVDQKAASATKAEASDGPIAINNQSNMPPIQPQIGVNINGLAVAAGGTVIPAQIQAEADSPTDVEVSGKPAKQPAQMEPQPGVEKDIVFWIVRLWEEWREENEQRKRSGDKPSGPPGSRKVAYYLNSHGYTMLHGKAGEHLRAARKSGLLDDRWDVLEAKGENDFDVDEANEERGFSRDPHGAGQTQKLKQERKDRSNDNWSDD